MKFAVSLVILLGVWGAGFVFGGLSRSASKITYARSVDAVSFSRDPEVEPDDQNTNITEDSLFTITDASDLLRYVIADESQTQWEIIQQLVLEIDNSYRLGEAESEWSVRVPEEGKFLRPNILGAAQFYGALWYLSGTSEALLHHKHPDMQRIARDRIFKELVFIEALYELEFEWNLAEETARSLDLDPSYIGRN